MPPKPWFLLVPTGAGCCVRIIIQYYSTEYTARVVLTYPYDDGTAAPCFKLRLHNIMQTLHSTCTCIEILYNTGGLPLHITSLDLDSRSTPRALYACFYHVTALVLPAFKKKILSKVELFLEARSFSGII